MTIASRPDRFVVLCLASIAALVASSIGLVGAQAHSSAAGAAGRQHSGFYAVHHLVSDGFVTADHVDPQLVNPWGIVFNPNAVVWIADNGTGVSTLYDGAGVKNPLVVEIPPPPGGTPPSAPTGIVFASGSDFVVTVGALSGPSRFIFSTEDGTISGWAPNVDLTHAILQVNNAPSGAIYKGLALAANGSGHFLYATDFHNNRVDVFDSSFHPVTLSGQFTDPNIPDGFAPFGIQNILGNLYVTYAKQDEDAEDDVAGAGLGFVDVYDANGHLIRRVATRGKLNAPWGLALAPADFGRFSGSLLVGNFGDGRINAYSLASGEFRGQLRGSRGQPLEIDGLWGLAFGNGLLGQPANSLFFTAGPGDEEHGLYGRIDSIPAQGNETN
jgi:uncharacterized protein (TIGR03118 family)